MRVGLLFPDRDLDLEGLPDPDPQLVTDLELDRLFVAMANGDDRIDGVVRRVVPAGAAGASARDGGSWADVVRHRQGAVDDALRAPDAIRALYRLAAEGVEVERRVWGGALRSAELVLRRSVEVLDGLLASVEQIRDVLNRERAAFSSRAFLALSDRMAVDVDDAFLASARDSLRRLREPTLVVTAALGSGNRPDRFVLHHVPEVRARLRDRVRIRGVRGLAIDVALHDQNAMNALAELRARAVADAAGAVAESAAHLLAFCRRLRDETAFLVGCINLDAALEGRAIARCLPDGTAIVAPGMAAAGIADPCLGLAVDGPLVPNDVDTLGCALTVVTGANGGGKSTLLRAAGVARLLQLAGMPVAAARFTAGLPTGILVHFPRPEQAAQASGRLDAELRRLEDLVGGARPGCFVLLNEPLSNVNERDASAILDELVRGLVAGGAEVWLVTHHHELATRLYASPPVPSRFLRAERGEGSARPFRVTEAPPLATSYGPDLWAGEVEDEGPDATGASAEHA